MTLSHRTVFTEAPNPHISFCWGRMQPPHRGHMGVINTVKATAKAGAWAIFVTKTHDNKKNPLTYDQKVKWLYALYPETKDHLVVDPSIKTIMQAAVYLYEKGFRSATFVAGEDDMPQLRKLLEDYNGKQMEQGFYKFEPFSFMESPRILNATNAREAAKSGDPDAFERATQVPQNLTVDGKTLFQTVRLGLGLPEDPTTNESLNESVMEAPGIEGEWGNEPESDADPYHEGFLEGLKSKTDGMNVRAQNPYETGSSAAKLWNRGFDSAQFEEHDIKEPYGYYGSTHGVNLDLRGLPTYPIKEAAEKSTKAVAKYQDMPHDGQRCDHCTMWRPPHGCSAVSGKIAANGWCSYYKRSHRKDLEETELDEAASPVLFHYTGSIGAALNILKNNEFMLSISTGSVEDQYAPKGYNYFLSTTRSKVGGYHEFTGGTAVMFNLDGNWFNRRYPVKAIDYWAGFDKQKHSESEDRVFSREPTIPADAITAIHILLKEAGEFASPTTRQLMLTAKKRGLPTYLYSDENAWKLQDTKRAIPVSKAQDLIRGQKKTGYISTFNGKKYLEPWLELIFKKSRSELSKEANKLRYSLTYWSGGQFADDLGLRNEITNARKPGNSGYETATKIIAAMRKIGANDVKGLLAFLHKKWDAEAQQKESVEEALDPNETHGWILPDRKVVYVTKEEHLGWLYSKNIDGYEEAFKLGYVRFAKATLTFFVQGFLDDLKKMYRVYAQTALGFKHIAVDVITDESGKIDNQISLDYEMPKDKAKFIKKFGPEQKIEHANSILGTVGGGAVLTDRKTGVFPWDKHMMGEPSSPKIPWLEGIEVGDSNIITEELLNEVNMSPSALKSAVDKLPLAKAGLEFELIVTEFEDADDDDYDPYEDFESEPDYDGYDGYVRASDWQDFEREIMDFFYGDHNSRRDVRSALERAREDYDEWLPIRFDTWANSPESGQTETRYQQWLDKTYGRDIANQTELFPELPPLDTYESFKKSHYNDWLEDYEENGDPIEDFLDDTTGGNYFSNFSNNYNLNWPYWTEPDYDSRPSRRGNGPPAESFRQAVGYPVQVSSGYHAQAQKAGYFKVEPDSSLHASSGRGGEGWEFVAPALKIPDMVDVIKKVAAWAKEGNAYTNRTTGLHMNVSLPGYNLQNLDYVKMALFLGDKYVLDTFGRLGNTYTKSALDNIENVIKRDPTKAEQALSLMRSNLNRTVSKLIHDTYTDKFTSINTKDNRIEIRSPGGNWLDMDLDAVINTLYRTVYALSIALDPEAEKEEYAKKFYKLLASGAKKEDTDTIKYFSQYVSGTIPKAALLSQIRNVQAKRDISRGKNPSTEEYQIMDRVAGKTVHTFYSNDPYAAYKTARDWADYNGYRFGDTRLVRVKTRAVTGNLVPTLPPISFTGDEQALGSGSNEYTIVFYNTDIEFKKIRADNLNDARDLADRWLHQHDISNGRVELRQDYMGVKHYYNITTGEETRTVGTQAQTQSGSSGTYVVVNRSDGTELLATQARSFYQASQAAQRFAQERGLPLATIAIRSPNNDNLWDTQGQTIPQPSQQTAAQSTTNIPDMPNQISGGRLYQMRRPNDSVIAQGTYTTTHQAIAAGREYANTIGLPLANYHLFSPNETQQTQHQAQQQAATDQQEFEIIADGNVVHRFNAASQGAAYQYAMRWANERHLAPDRWEWRTVQGVSAQPSQPRQYADWEIERGYDMGGNAIPADVIAQHRAQPRSETTYNILGSMGGVYHTFTATSETAARRYAQSWATEHNMGPGYTVVAVPERNESIEESLTESFLAEIRMNPKSLEAFAQTPVAQEMRVGFETEMYVPGLGNEEEEAAEYDYDADEDFPGNDTYKARNNAIIEFFTNGENYNSRRTVERAIDAMYEDFNEFQSDTFANDYEDSDEWKQDIADEAGKPFDELSDEEIDDARDAVREAWESNNEEDVWKDFLSSRDIHTMQSFMDYSANRNDEVLGWPYMTDGGSSSGDVTYEDLVDNFESSTGFDARESSGYHGTDRGDYWIFEPDSSLDSPDDYGDGGVELVSPPMLLDDGLAALQTVFKWAKSNGYYTNRTTGFHIGVSIPEQTMENINHLKLVLLLGDKYVLERFGRLNSRWTKSMLDQAKKATEFRDFRKTLPQILDDARAGLLDQTNKEINKIISGTRGDRYVSVNIKSNYIEFRSAGGNYFEQYDEIRNTMLRYVRAMAAAADPEDSKQEYAKKFYKLIVDSIKQPTSTVDIFAKYVAGGISKDELIAQVTAAQKKREPVKPIGQGKIVANIESNDGDSVVEVRGEGINEIVKLANDWLRERNQNPSNYVFNWPFYSVWHATMTLSTGTSRYYPETVMLLPKTYSREEAASAIENYFIPNMTKEQRNAVNLSTYDYFNSSIAAIAREINKIEAEKLDFKPSAKLTYEAFAYRIEDYNDHVIGMFDPAKYTLQQVIEIATQLAAAHDNTMLIYRGTRRLEGVGTGYGVPNLGKQDINLAHVIGSGKQEFYVISTANRWVYLRVRANSYDDAITKLKQNYYRIARSIEYNHGDFELWTPQEYAAGVRKPKPQPQPKPQQNDIIVNRIGSPTAPKVFRLYSNNGIEPIMDVGAATQMEAYELLLQYYKERGLDDTVRNGYEQGRYVIREV